MEIPNSSPLGALKGAIEMRPKPEDAETGSASRLRNLLRGDTKNLGPVDASVELRKRVCPSGE